MTYYEINRLKSLVVASKAKASRHHLRPTPMRGKMKILVWLGLLSVSTVPLLAQARPEDGGHEFQVWTGGGHSVPGGTSDTSVWNAGLRYGWILTTPHGPGFLKG